MNELILAYAGLALIVLGFNLQKASSPSIDERDPWFWVSVLIGMLLAPVTFLLMVGCKLHGE